MPNLSRHIIVALAANSLVFTQVFASNLYRTGPQEDIGYVRFINNTTSLITVRGASQQSLSLAPDAPISAYLTAAVSSPLQGAVEVGTTRVPINTRLTTESFLTILVSEVKGEARIVTLRESPDDFSALRASLGLYFDPAICPAANVRIAGTSIILFNTSKEVPRRQVNPVTLSGQLECDGQVIGEPTAPVALQAGGRYSLVVQSHGALPSLLVVEDQTAR